MQIVWELGFPMVILMKISIILAEHPHFSAVVQFISNWTLGIIPPFERHDNGFPHARGNLQVKKRVAVLVPVITESYSEYLYLDIEVFKKLLDIFFVIIVQIYNNKTKYTTIKL